MASALFLGSWAALMGPMIYGMSAHYSTLASQHPSDFSLPTLLSILWLWLPMHPTRQSLVPLSLTTDPHSQTLAISGETAVHGDLFRKYWADTLLRRRGTSSSITSPHHISLPHTTLHHGTFVTAVSAPCSPFIPTRHTSRTLRNHRKDSVLTSSFERDSHAATLAPTPPPFTPHAYRITITTPPTLTLFCFS